MRTKRSTCIFPQFTVNFKGRMPCGQANNQRTMGAQLVIN